VGVVKLGEKTGELVRGLGENVVPLNKAVGSAKLVEVENEALRRLEDLSRRAWKPMMVLRKQRENSESLSGEF
jgi:hypothetical protein